MRSFINKYKSAGRYSQNGEEGILKEILKRMKLAKGTAVEFGGGDGFYCSNTAHLRDKGWTVHMYDIKAVDPYVHQKLIGPNNVNELPECDILSVDVDGNDYGIWKAYNGHPKIVIIEINSSVNPLSNQPVSDKIKGTGYKPMVELGLSKGYFLIGHVGNLIFVLNEYKNLFPELTADPIKEVNEYFDYSWIKVLA